MFDMFTVRTMIALVKLTFIVVTSLTGRRAGRRQVTGLPGARVPFIVGELKRKEMTFPV